ncbi:MAG: hypothetical protein Q8N91_04385 [Candidatus Omnitrophota bacterium]|nr:hypothetical protein [Candidatus Omnitrophota bacterium]
MLTKSIFWTTMVVCVAASLPLCLRAHAEESMMDPWATSFHDQVKRSNDVYVKNNILVHLESVDKLNKEIREASLSRFNTGLDLGDAKESDIDKVIASLVAFQKKHNARLEGWAGKNTAFGSFVDPLKMRAAQVKSLKDARFPQPWPFAAIHWYPRARKLKLENQEIPKDGLGFKPDLWQDADALTQKYALFSFMRKTLNVRQFEEAFLDDQTGYKSFWKISSKAINFKRWRYQDYYIYRYISPLGLPAAEKGNLKFFVLVQCALSRGTDKFQDFYNAKLRFFADLTEEMKREDCVRMAARTYMDLYAFVCRSFPCVSAFRIKDAAAGASIYEFLDGYPGDKPARMEFGENSPAGIAFRLYERLNTSSRGSQSQRELTERIFSPILLLQFRLPADFSNRLTDFPYEDIKVGFKGYLDFYDALTAPGPVFGKKAWTIKGIFR